MSIHERLKVMLVKGTQLTSRYSHDPDLKEVLTFLHELDLIEERKRELTFYRNNQQTKATVSQGLVFSMFNTGFQNPYAS